MISAFLLIAKYEKVDWAKNVDTVGALILTVMIWGVFIYLWRKKEFIIFSSLNNKEKPNEVAPLDQLSAPRKSGK